MLNSFNISKGHNLLIDGVPQNKIIEVESPSSLVFNPSSIDGIKTKLLIKEGDDVKVGSPLYYNKKNPEAFFVSTCSGKVTKIIYGDRRVVTAIHVSNDNQYKSENLDFLADSAAATHSDP